MEKNICFRNLIDKYIISETKINNIQLKIKKKNIIE